MGIKDWTTFFTSRNIINLEEQEEWKKSGLNIGQVFPADGTDSEPEVAWNNGWKILTAASGVNNLSAKLKRFTYQSHGVVTNNVEPLKIKKTDVDGAHEWIENEILKKTNEKDLPEDDKIRNNNHELDPIKLPDDFKNKVRLIRDKKKIEFFLEPTITLTKIRKHLMQTKYDWESWEYLLSREEKDDENYILALMFEDFKKKGVVQNTLVQNVLSEVKKVVEKGDQITMQDCKELDTKWGSVYDDSLDFLGYWSTLQEYLKEEASQQIQRRLEKEVEERMGWEYLNQILNNAKPSDYDDTMMDIINKWTARGVYHPEERAFLYEKLEKIVEDCAQEPELLEGNKVKIHFGKAVKEEGVKWPSVVNALAFAAYPNIWVWEPEDRNAINGRKDKWDSIDISITVAHELAHTIVNLREAKPSNDSKYLPRTQWHSKAFWEIFLGSDWRETPEPESQRATSTLDFMKNKFKEMGEEVISNQINEFIKASNEKLDNISKRWVYFPNSNQMLAGKIERKKYFDAENIDEAWKKIRREVFELVNNSMNAAQPSSWNQLLYGDPINEPRWVQIYVRQAKENILSNEDYDNSRRFKIYIFHNNKNEEFEWKDKNGQKEFIPAESAHPILDEIWKDLEQYCPADQGWEIRGISVVKARSLISKFAEYTTCGYSARIEIPVKN